MKCGFCGYEFEPHEADYVCAGCPLVGNCRLVRCPRCGYEMPLAAKLIRLVRRVMNRSGTEIVHGAPDRAEGQTNEAE